MKILHISDTHSKHSFLEMRDDVDTVIHTGDATYYRDLELNKQDFDEFLEWYKAYPVNNKIFIAGNHDRYLFEKNKEARKKIEKSGIVYLEDSYITIDGFKIFGSPWTPEYGNWYFQSCRSKLNKRWEKIDDDVDIILNHGMPKGILDITEDRYHQLERAGDGALFKRTQKLPKLKLYCGGHLHNNSDIINTGLRVLNGVTYSNAAMIKDGQFEKIDSYHYGNIITLKIVTTENPVF